MASAISAEQVPMKVEPEELPDASGTCQGETEPGVFDVLPRSEKRPFQSPLYRKGFTMESEVDIAKELEKGHRSSSERCAAQLLGSGTSKEARWALLLQLSKTDSLASKFQHMASC